MRYILTLLLLSAAILKTAAQENYTLADTLTLDAVVVTGEKLLFESEQEFSKTQVLHKNKENNLRVEDLLKVSKYSIAFAEMMNPDEENKELASAAITVFQGIETEYFTFSQAAKVMGVSRQYILMKRLTIGTLNC